MRSDRVIEVIAVIVLAMILIGEFVVYSTDHDKYSSSADLKDGTLEYSLTANGSVNYSVLVMDNGDMGAMTEVYIYYDETYVSDYEDVLVPIGAEALDQRYYIDQLVKQLDYRGCVKTTILGASGLSEAMSSDVTSGEYCKGLIVISGALPDTVYTGTYSDLVFQWMNSGGRLYWLGNLIGCQYATTSELIPVIGYQKLFFGGDCLNEDEGLDKAYSDEGGNDLRSTLSLMNNSVKYAINVDKITALKGVDKVLALGYAEDGYASIVMTDFGKGMICIIGGDYSNDQRSDLAQIVSSQLCYETKVLEHTSGEITRSTISGTIDIGSTEGVVAAYLYFGGYYSVHGDYYSF